MIFRLLSWQRLKPQDTRYLKKVSCRQKAFNFVEEPYFCVNREVVEHNGSSQP